MVSKIPGFEWTLPNAISKRIRVFFLHESAFGAHETRKPAHFFGYDGFANSCRRLKLCTRFQPDWIRLDGDEFIFFSGDRVGVIKRNSERYDLVKMKSTES